MLVWGTTTIYLVLFEGILKARAAGAFVVLLIFCIQSYAIWFIDADLKQATQLVPASAVILADDTCLDGNHRL